LFGALPFEVLEAFDNAPDAVECYNLNLGPHARCVDLTTLPVEEMRRADVLMGGFPCQDFSSSGPKTGFDGKRGQLYRVLIEYMQHHRPKIVVGENVSYLERLHGGRYLETILRECEAEGYHFDVWELYGPDYGLPQSRRRLFLVGVRDDFVGFPAKPQATHRSRHLTISEALCDLEGIQDESVPNQSQYFVSTCATSGGGQGDHTNDPDKVSYCIRANSRGRIQFHYRLPRRLTVRECARLQSFPDQFVFPFTAQRNLTLIGNAVPPLLGHAVAQSVADFLQVADCAGGDHDSDTARSSVQQTRTHAFQPSLFAV
jgi:DNA (cytosine-5)-methyltransferase 1